MHSIKQAWFSGGNLEFIQLNQHIESFSSFLSCFHQRTKSMEIYDLVGDLLCAGDLLCDDDVFSVPLILLRFSIILFYRTIKLKVGRY